MVKHICIIGAAILLSFNAKSQSSLYPWHTGVFSFGLGSTKCSIDTGIWSWKNLNPGIKADSVLKTEFSHLSVPLRLEVLSKWMYVNSHANFSLPLILGHSPQGYNGHINQSFSFRIGIGACIKKRLSSLPNVQFETSNLYITGKGIPSNDILNSSKGIHYYSYMGKLYSGVGITSYGSITHDIGFRIGYQKNKIQFADNYGNTEKYHGGPRKIWDFALYVKKVPGLKKSCAITFRYNIINQHINGFEMNDSKPGYGLSYVQDPEPTFMSLNFLLSLVQG